MSEEIDTLLEEIKSTETAELRKEYRERKIWPMHCKPVQRQNSCFVRR